jgi:hypothetical protein
MTVYLELLQHWQNILVQSLFIFPKDTPVLHHGGIGSCGQHWFCAAMAAEVPEDAGNTTFKDHIIIMLVIELINNLKASKLCRGMGSRIISNTYPG